MNKILPLDPEPQFLDYDAYKKYCRKIDERICKLIEKGWDSEEFADYKAGEIDREEIYRFAHKEACKQVYEEVTDFGYEPF